MTRVIGGRQHQIHSRPRHTHTQHIRRPAAADLQHIQQSLCRHSRCCTHSHAHLTGIMGYVTQKRGSEQTGDRTAPCHTQVCCARGIDCQLATHSEELVQLLCELLRRSCTPCLFILRQRKKTQEPVTPRRPGDFLAAMPNPHHDHLPYCVATLANKWGG